MMFALLLLALPATVAAAQPAAKTPFDSETLAYSINWPSGLSLGDARMQASRDGGDWHFALSFDAAVPGFAVKDDYRSTASAEFCSAELVKQFSHGKKSNEEKTTFDAQKGVATRVTINPAGGGSTQMNIQGCARDALSFLYFLRRELAQGRIPGPQTVYFGGPYQLRLEYVGTQSIRANDHAYDADRVRASFKGPASEMTFELFFTRDAARTPVVIRVPFALGTFSMELVR
jgi:hypothetical protein